MTKDPFPGLLTQPASLTAYVYALNNPIEFTDPSGEFVETIFDVASLGYDIYTIGDKLSRGCAPGWSDWVALGLDALSLAIPFVPALGMTFFITARADYFGNLSRAINEISDFQKLLPMPKRANFPYHHIFPQRSDLARRFALQGINIHEHLMEIPIEIHKKIHSSSPRGGLWNRAWESFFEKRPQATAIEIYKHAGWLIHEFDLDIVGKNSNERKLMKLFCVKPDDLYWGRQYKYQIDASHKWGLPGVNCDICGNTWAMTGVIYPAVDLSNLPNEKRFRKAHVVSVAEYLTSQRYIFNLFSSTLFLPPGTEFGPMVGKAWGKFGDFAWTNPWTMLMQRKTYEMLTSKGILLSPQYSTPELIYRAKSTPDLVEPQIEPMARMAKSAFTPVDTSICSFCGYDPHKLHKLIVEASSIPINLDLFRSRDHPTHIFATERFVEEIKILQLSDISFFDVIVE